MAFIRTKRIRNGSVVYQVVQARRDGTRVIQTVLVSLGHEATLGAALTVAAHHERDTSDPRWRAHWVAQQARQGGHFADAGLPRRPVDAPARIGGLALVVGGVRQGRRAWTRAPATPARSGRPARPHAWTRRPDR